MHEFRLRFHWNLFLRSEFKNSGIVSDNGFSPTLRQAIIWTDYGWFTDTFASLGLNELNTVIIIIPLINLQFPVYS